MNAAAAATVIASSATSNPTFDPVDIKTNHRHATSASTAIAVSAAKTARLRRGPASARASDYHAAPFARLTSTGTRRLRRCSEPANWLTIPPHRLRYQTGRERQQHKDEEREQQERPKIRYRILDYCGDPGLLGPDPVSRRVIGHAAAFVGGIRALLVQTAHPEVVAGVAQHSRYRSDPLGRLSRTSVYVTETTYGARPEVDAAVAAVRRRADAYRGVAQRLPAAMHRRRARSLDR